MSAPAAAARPAPPAGLLLLLALLVLAGLGLRWQIVTRAQFGFLPMTTLEPVTPGVQHPLGGGTTTPWFQMNTTGLLPQLWTERVGLIGRLTWVRVPLVLVAGLLLAAAAGRRAALSAAITLLALTLAFTARSSAPNPGWVLAALSLASAVLLQRRWHRAGNPPRFQEE